MDLSLAQLQCTIGWPVDVDTPGNRAINSRFKNKWRAPSIELQGGSG